MNEQPLATNPPAIPSLLAVYDTATDTFSYHKDMAAYFGAELEGQLFWHFLQAQGIVTPEVGAQIAAIVHGLDEQHCVFYCVFPFGVMGRHILSFTYHEGKVLILVKLFDQGDLDDETIKYDELTRLISRSHFCREAARTTASHPSLSHAMLFFDINAFKAVNELVGYKKGDALLVHIANLLKSGRLPIVHACRVSADKFACLVDTTHTDAKTVAEELVAAIQAYPLPLSLSIHVGIYPVPQTETSGEAMLDRAMLAQSTIKGSYTRTVCVYDDAMRHAMLSEQEITSEMELALAQGQFVLFYQPQYNHSTGMLVGAEALVRWHHPTKGMISPAQFIPLFERNGFITKLDLYVFEQAAAFQRACIDAELAVVPVSINFSKLDIFSEDFVPTLERIRTRYGIDAKLLRIEITESVLIGNNTAIGDILARLHACGYVIEMDDFGSGYSSLNVLKDLDFDVIKLDMLFLENKGEGSRGGTILSSVINMAKWLNLSVIAEGVETVEQADFLRSIGCDYIQGYLYAKPLPEQDYRALLGRSHIGALIPQMTLDEKLHAIDFWDPTSQETLIFSNFVGAAAILSYNRTTHALEILRVNQKYLRELGMNLSEHDVLHKNPADTLSELQHATYLATLERAIETGEEQECETWREIRSDCCGTEHFCIRSTVAVIGRSSDHVLFHCMIRNITSEKQSLTDMQDAERRFKMASEQVNIYFWEYTIATREMRPCFRCMRDLGLPPLLRNYPDSAIERGIFPPEVADMYRDWHVQVANGVKELEAVIPLTADRVPFRVRYTTEFDENGHPVKAYGSAALIVN